MDRILGREDPDVSERVRARFEAEGVRVLTGHKALRVERDAGRQSLICQGPDGEVALGFDAILVALGRRANTKGFGLEEIGVELDPNGTVAVDGLLRTNFPNIFASGDAAGPYQFTHTAAHQSWYATVNALFGRFKRFKVDYRVIPWATFTDPEVARVGLNQTEATQKQIPYEVTTYSIGELDRAIADSEDHGLVRVLTKPGSDKILGVTIVGAHAGDLISEFVLAMKHNLGLNKILGTIHIYPTLTEANKYAAGMWKKAHAPEGLLRWIGRYHAWMRS
jgi:pyruvate/2-oxoglutarate dehydrogenase complex dihydrolipoamide dehydrogenase (E3) component